MSHEDPYRPNPGRDRGAYTPPTDDDLPFDRGGYDPRRGGGPAGGGGKAPPLTLIISGVVLLLLIIAVVVYYQAGPRASGDAPPAVGAPVGDLKTAAPVEAQPVDPEAGIDVYSGGAPTSETPTFTPPPEAVQPRPAPQPEPVAPAATRPTPPAATTPPPAKAEPAAPATTGGTSGVQIGAFSTPAIAEREYGQVVGRYPSLTRGSTRRVQEVTSSSGSTLYRTTVTGLSREQATALCSAIKSNGGDCIVR
ncbi:SPOR domain-containing protein [Brevundimonas sp.]|uniref:SPOR domain-containing protein n=1 Tax=Brevundimonas sp. TaxID=1871086 RepID=UPI003F728631